MLNILDILHFYISIKITFRALNCLTTTSYYINYMFMITLSYLRTILAYLPLGMVLVYHDALLVALPLDQTEF